VSYQRAFRFLDPKRKVFEGLPKKKKKKKRKKGKGRSRTTRRRRR
jgi:hypothetical protein